MAPGILEKGILLKMRFALDLYVNLRPVKLFPGVETPLKDKGPKDIDFVVVRENTEGLYAGAGGVLKKGTPDEVAIQESINTRKGVERCIRYAFEYCERTSGRKKLSLCGKTNVLTYAFDLWERAFYEVAKEYPEIKTDYAHVDATDDVDGEEPGMVRCHRHGQHVRRHHHRPWRDDPGRHGYRRGRQHQPGRRLDVRADRRFRAEVYGS